MKHITKTVTEAKEVLEKKMTELNSVITSLTEQLKESISISTEEHECSERKL